MLRLSSRPRTRTPARASTRSRSPHQTCRRRLKSVPHRLLWRDTSTLPAARLNSPGVLLGTSPDTACALGVPFSSMNGRPTLGPVPLPPAMKLSSSVLPRKKPLASTPQQGRFLNQYTPVSRPPGRTLLASSPPPYRVAVVERSSVGGVAAV